MTDDLLGLSIVRRSDQMSKLQTRLVKKYLTPVSYIRNLQYITIAKATT